LSSSRDFAEDLFKTTRTIGLEKIASLLTALQKRTPKVEDDAIIKFLMYAPLIDLHDTTIEFGVPDIDLTREDLHFAQMKLRKYLPQTVEAYDLVHTTVGSAMTFVDAKSKLGGNGQIAGSTHIKTDNDTFMDMGTGAFAFAIWVREVTVATHGLVNKRNIVNTTNAGFEVWISGGNTVNVSVADGTNTALLTASVSLIALNDGNWHSIIINIPATGNMEVFVDKVSKGTQSTGSVASVNNTRDYFMFARDNDGTIQDEGTMLVSSWVWKKGEIFISAQRDQWHDDGVVDLDAATDTEITTFEFDNNDKPMPNAFEGKFIGN